MNIAVLLLWLAMGQKPGENITFVPAPDVPHTVTFENNGVSTLIVDLHDGHVTFGPGVTTDEASKAFWKGIYAYMPKCEFHGGEPGGTEDMSPFSGIAEEKPSTEHKGWVNRLYAGYDEVLPLDVPAVQERHTYQRPPHMVFATFRDACAHNGEVSVIKTKEGKEDEVCIIKRWTCRDRSRVLLTSEDGKKWCHKLQTEGK